jgi:hypothetical protein
MNLQMPSLPNSPFFRIWGVPLLVLVLIVLAVMASQPILGVSAICLFFPASMFFAGIRWANRGSYSSHRAETSAISDADIQRLVDQAIERRVKYKNKPQTKQVDKDFS